MPITLLESAKLAPTAEAEVVIEQFARSSEVLRVLPWENISGNAKSYTQEDKLPGIGWRGFNF